MQRAPAAGRRTVHSEVRLAVFGADLMFRFATLKIALLALRRNTLRTLLTMLGIIFGVGAVIAMVAMGNGAKAQMEARVATLGQNVVQVFSGSSSRGGFRMGFGSAGTLT